MTGYFFFFGTPPRAAALRSVSGLPNRPFAAGLGAAAFLGSGLRDRLRSWSIFLLRCCRWVKGPTKSSLEGLGELLGFAALGFRTLEVLFRFAI